MQLFFIPIGYLVGSIPFGWLAVKLFRKEDIRRSGSGATGATNVGRKLGVRIGALVAALDILKAFVPTLTAVLLWPDADWIHVLTMLSVNLGHSKSLYLKFTGGKSVSTSAGSILAWSIVQPNIGIVAGAAIGVVVFMTVITDRMSVGSLSGIFVGAVLIVTFLLIDLVSPTDLIPTAYGLGLLGLGVWICLTHIENIKRLVRGQERRLNFIKKIG